MKIKTINYLPPSDLGYHEELHNLFPEQISELNNIKSVTFQVTEDCCMACTYCYQHNKTKNKMTFDIAQKFIDNLLADKYENINTSNTFALILEFIGGEPLMEIDLIEQICEYILNKMIILDHPWLYYLKCNICSNGILYQTPKVQNFFKKYGMFFSFAISIDGNKELHDSCRIDLNGNGTYNRAIAAAHDYKNKFGAMPHTKMTVAPENVNYIYEAIINLINEGYTFIPFNCVFENVWNIDHAKIYYHQLKNIADYLIENDLYNKINIRIFNEDYHRPQGEDENLNWCGGTTVDNLALDYKGNLHPCIRYMASSLNNKQDPIIVGSIHEGYLQTELHKQNFNKITNITRRSQSTDECFYCPISSGCAWCSAYNYEEFGTPNKRATYICNMHKAEALANVYYWNKLYQYLGINKVFKMHIPKQWALEIINNDEYNYLQTLSEGEN